MDGLIGTFEMRILNRKAIDLIYRYVLKYEYEVRMSENGEIAIGSKHGNTAWIYNNGWTSHDKRYIGWIK